MNKFKILYFLFGRIPIGSKLAKILHWFGVPKYVFCIRIPLLRRTHPKLLDIDGVQPMAEPDPNATWKFNIKYSDDVSDDDKFGGCF